MAPLQHGWIDGGMIAVMCIGIIGLIWTRVASDRGIGRQAIQFMGVCLLIPALVILSLEDKVSKENLGTILGAIIGYVLAGISETADKRSTGGGKNDKVRDSNEP